MIRALSILTIAVALCGCGKNGFPGGGPVNQKASNDLKQLGLAYHSYFDANMKGPAKPADLLKYVEGNQALIGMVESRMYVLYMDVKISQLPSGSSSTILGYAGNTPASGGLVLMADGLVTTMTAAEFAAAPKAEK